MAAIWAMPHGHLAQAASRTRISSALAAAPAAGPAGAAAAGDRSASRPASAALPEAASFHQVPPPVAARPGHQAVAPPAVVRPPAPKPAAPLQGGGWGYDISWPQCDGAYPGAHDVGTVGVTDGRPFTTNPCLAAQYGWTRASRFPGGSQAYLNLELDGTSAGPHHCAADDHLCRAYDYGVLTAADAIGRATSHGVRPDFWWLDVEIGNNWSDTSPEWNAQTVQGAIDLFTSRGLAVGVYSSYDQWTMIVPDSYRPNVPVWRAVVGDADMAPSMCAQSHSFTAGPVLMVQYDDHQFDQDFVCPEGHRAFAAAAARPH